LLHRKTYVNSQLPIYSVYRKAHILARNLQNLPEIIGWIFEPQVAFQPLQTSFPQSAQITFFGSSKLSRPSTIRATLAITIVLVLASATLHAQTGILLGKLTDNQSTPLVEATVTLRNLATGATSQTTTGKNGSYRFQDLAPGEYSLAASIPQLGNGGIDGILISPSHTTRVQAALLLELPPPPILPEVEAHSADPIASTIAAEDLNALPLTSRDWQAFAAIAPGVNTIPQSGAGGQLPGQSGGHDGSSADSSETLSLDAASALADPPAIDGIPSAPAFRLPDQRQATDSQSVGESAIQSVTVRPGNAPAGEANPPASINITTRHGENGFHGQVFYLNRQNLFNARNPFTRILEETSPAAGIAIATFAAQPYTPPISRQTFGLGLGRQFKPKGTGSDKLFWFAALDGLYDNDPAVASLRHPADFFLQPTIPDLDMLAARLGPGNLQSSAACPAGGLPANAIEEQAAACYSGFLEQMVGMLGPVPRTSVEAQLFGRIDWNVTERHHLSAEANTAYQNAPSGALTRASETYASHSFGNSQSSEFLAVAKLDSFLTANLLSAATFEFRRHNQTDSPQSPPTTGLEAELLPYTSGTLPQIVADTRDGFVLGNPTSVGKGSYPLENSFVAHEIFSYVRGAHLLKAGASFDHVSDSVNTLVNQNGSFAYADVLNFISDAAAIETFGFATYNPTGDYHNCDATGRVYSRGIQTSLGGLGSLPCYASFSQRIGPSDWHLSTNDLAAFVTDQWQPAHNFTLSAGLRVQLQQLPPAIASVRNNDPKLSENLPANPLNFAPRLGLAWSPSSGTVLRLGAGLYYGRIDNSALLAALTQTGSLNGDLNFFFRPTDFGAPLFPLAYPVAPQNAVAPGAVSFAPHFRNQEIDQAVFSLEQRLPSHWVLSLSAMASLGRRLPISADTNLDTTPTPATPANITYAVVDSINGGPIKSPTITVPLYSERIDTGYQQLATIESRANSTYQAEMIKLVRNGGHGLSLRAHYLYAHATDWNPNESGNVAVNDILDPKDFSLEYGTSNLDIRHSAAATILYATPALRGNKARDWAGILANGWAIAAVGQYRSGLPYTMRTGGYIPGFYSESGSLFQGVATGMNGSGGDNRLYGIGSNGVDYNLGRNTFRYPATWTADARLTKRLFLPKGKEMEFFGESFNLFNHQNVTLLETTGYTVRRGTPPSDPFSAPGPPTLNFMSGLTRTGQPSETPEFGKPLDVNATNFYHPRQFQLGLRMRF
jgi:Carboxypeptidase regulatory-like domain